MAPFVVMLIGLAIAYRNYIAKPDAPAAFVAMFPRAPPLPDAQMVFRRALRPHLRPPGDGARPLLLEARRRADHRPLRPARRGLAVGVGNRITARFQSGYVYSYALVMLLGLIGAATWVFWWVR